MAMILRKVLSKYQITLPRDAVKMLRIRRGDLLQCQVRDRSIVLSPVEISSKQQATGLLDQISRKWERLGITQKDVEEAVRQVRKH